MIYYTTWKEDLNQTGHEKAYTLLRVALKREFGITKLPHIERGTYGKPYFFDVPQIHFNISHTKRAAVVSLLSMEHGIDIEEPRKVTERLFYKVLTEWEQEQFQKEMKKTAEKDLTKFLESKDGKEIFLRFWTLKESYIKADGRGLICPLKEIEFSLLDRINDKEKKGENNWKTLTQVSSSHPEYQFFQGITEEENIISLACKKGEAKKIEWEKISTIFKNIITV